MLSLLLLIPAPAEAAAYYFLDAGTRGMSRAGAYVAGAEDLSAQYYNPAALIRLERPQFYVNFSLVGQPVEFTRKDYDSSGALVTTHETVENLDPPMQIPAFGVSGRFGLPNTVFALGFYPPFAPTVRYDEEGPQRFTVLDSDVVQIYAGPSVAHRFTDWLTVGAGVAWTLFSAKQSLTLSTFRPEDEPDDYAENPDKYDVDVLMEMMDPARVTFNAGVLLQPSDRLAIGASVVPPINVRGKGSITADFGEDHFLVAEPYELLEGSKFTDDDVTVLLSMPLIARLGVAFRPIEPLEVEIAGVYEGWSVTEEIRVTDVNLALPLNEESILLATTEDPPEEILVEDDVVLPANYQSAFSLRLGGELDVTDLLSARGGVAYESTAIPPKTQSVTLIDGNKWTYGLGGSLNVKKRFYMDVGFSQTWIQSREIKDSEVTQIVIPLYPLDPATLESDEGLSIEEGSVVGNGSFASHATMMSVGITWMLDKPK